MYNLLGSTLYAPWGIQTILACPVQFNFVPGWIVQYRLTPQEAHICWILLKLKTTFFQGNDQIIQFFMLKVDNGRIPDIRRLQTERKCGPPLSTFKSGVVWRIDNLKKPHFSVELSGFDHIAHR